MPEREVITLPVRPEAAEAFRRATQSERDQLRDIVELKLMLGNRRRDAAEEAIRLMRQIGEEAQRKGMTRRDIQQLLGIADEEMNNIFGDAA